MDIFGVGASEFVFIILIAIIILGPKDMQKAGRTIGRWLNQLVRSDGWKAFQQTSREIRNMPTTLMREAEMEKELRKATDLKTPASNSTRNLPQPNEPEHTIQPPTAKPSDEHESSQS